MYYVYSLASALNLFYVGVAMTRNTEYAPKCFIVPCMPGVSSTGVGLKGSNRQDTVGMMWSAQHALPHRPHTYTVKCFLVYSKNALPPAFTSLPARYQKWHNALLTTTYDSLYRNHTIAAYTSLNEALDDKGWLVYMPTIVESEDSS